MKPITLAFNIIACLLLALMLFLSLSLIVFQFYKFDLGDAWTFSGSIFGGTSTLAAAYVASKMFNDWKDQHNKTIYSDFAIKNISMLQELIISLNKHIFIKNDIESFLKRFPSVDLNNTHTKDNFNLIAELYNHQIAQTKEKLNNYKFSSELILLTIDAKDALQHIERLNSQIDSILKVNYDKIVDNIPCQAYLDAITNECQNLDTIIYSRIHIDIIKALTPYIKA